MRIGRVLIALLGVSLVTASCAPPVSEPTGRPLQASEQAQTASQGGSPQRTLVVALRGEPPSIATKPIVDFSGALSRPTSLFNATLDYRDEFQNPQAELAEAIPQLNTDTWRLFPDGRMETTYRLKTNLAWHDGMSVSAEDFVFAWQVYATPAFGVSKSLPIGLMEQVSAPDPRTVVIRWRQPYPDAVSLDRDFQALPRHILAEAFRDLADPVGFSGLPFWTSEYVGLGPYRMTAWEPGAFISGEAFDRYVLGRPKIDKIELRVMGDPATAVANLLADAVHLVIDPILAVTDGEILEHQWAGDKGGTVLYSPVALRTSLFQFRPEHVEHPALLEVQVRRAVAHGIDRATAVEILTAGKGVPTDTMTSPREKFYPEIERVIQKYPYDPRRAQQVMEQAGYTKGPAGFFVGRDGQPIRFGVASSSGTRNESEVAAYVDNLQRAGFDAYPRIVSTSEIRDPQLRALLPGMQVRGGANEPQRYVSAEIPRPENRWFGENRGGWSSSEFDRLNETFLRTLDRSEQVRLTAEIERLLTTEVPLIPNYFGVYTMAHVSALQGPIVRPVPPADNTVFIYVHRWEWRS
jgi:peptide/nickel transport system substrate-binding protein